MSSYNLMKKADRQRMRADRGGEIKALQDGTWPRTIDEQMRWGATTRETEQEHAMRMCKADLAYLRDLEKRVQAGELEGYEQ